jgi:hypothetical protein
MPIDWENTTKRTAPSQGCTVCHEPTVAAISIGARLLVKDSDGRKTGANGKLVASKQRSFCRSHANEIYEKLESIMP